MKLKISIQILELIKIMQKRKMERWIDWQMGAKKRFGPHLSCDGWVGGRAGLRIAYSNNTINENKKKGPNLKKQKTQSSPVL